MADGHEKINSTTTSTLAKGITNVGSSFITNSSSPYDWVTTDDDGYLRADLWFKSDGTGVCPVGFRVPTYEELQTETFDNGVRNEATAFSNFLKLPVAGGRDGFNGSLGYLGSWGAVWTIGLMSGSLAFNFDSSNSGLYDGYRATGLSIRCVEN